MPGYYRLRPEDLLPSDEELQMMRTAQSAPGTGGAIGSAIGTGLGALAGGLIGNVPGAGIGATLGGTAGQLIGSGIGGMIAEGPEKQLADIEMQRQGKIEAQQMRDEALRRLLESA
jgi:uncharacterized protein YcfJ